VAYQSAPGDLALHGVRVLGFPTAYRVAGRYRLDADAVADLLLDHEDLLATLGLERGRDN